MVDFTSMKVGSSRINYGLRMDSHHGVVGIAPSPMALARQGSPWAALPWVLTSAAVTALLLGLALLSSMAIAALIGSSVPMILQKFGIDPAVATGPFITTSVDVLATLIFFQLAVLLILRNP